MKRIIIYILRSLTKLLSYIVPTNNKLFVFVSYPDFADNSFAIFRYLLQEHGRKDIHYCWLLSDKTNKLLIMNQLNQWNCTDVNIKIIPRKSIKAIWYAYRSRYIFNTVGLFIHIVFHQKDKRINMWHGMPIKRIYSSYPNGDITIATSHLFSKFMSQGLKIDDDNVLVIGQPRNDFLFKPDLLNSDINCMIRKYRKIGIWMPTFRRSYRDSSYSDGLFEDNQIAFISLKELNTINELLLKHNALLIIKLHPLDVLQNQTIPDKSNILILKNDNFNQKDLYPLLASCDFLISDYSSVVIDYEILKRPIGITIGDKEDYRNTRGFFIEDIPGLMINNEDELLFFMKSCLTDEIKLNDYGNLYNLYRDDKACERLISFLNIE